ncbi:condensation domain-containing protein [Nostoc favosum]|uniref:Condensation domain-containing protein n=1 Tax=Nostoc favosum CHAB5714 TaxID=2780399 RepID=A0ABS8ICM3_9NOSO|nr:condensation domain-containing protein [Nostoc favosum]MCC5601606.1 condensation domain-containing protein [Nostoc favosum CHAB5714]
MKTENIEDIYELTPLEKGILFHCLYAENESQLYFFQHLYTVRNLDTDIFEKSWQFLVDRHTILRTGFYWEEIDNPLQVVYKQVKVSINQYDWRNLDRIEQENKLENFIKSDRELNFDISRPCLMRLSLIRLTDDFYQLIWTYNFIIIDGWTGALLMDEFAQIYEALVQNKEISLAPTRPYRDYINWLQEQDIAKTEIFWRQTLQGVKRPTPLTYIERIDKSSSQEERYDEEIIKISSEKTRTIESLVKKYRLTLATIINGIWAILLSRYSRLSDVMYGCTVTGRPTDLYCSESIAGVFVNTLPICVKVETNQSWLSWMQNLQIQLAETRKYEYTPLTEIHNWSEIPRDIDLFDSHVVIEQLPDVKFTHDYWEEFLGFTLGKLYYKGNYPLALVIYPEEELSIAFSYDSRRFDVSTIIGILRDIEMLLHQFIADPNIQIKDLLFSTEKQRLITSILENEVSVLGVSKS